MRKLLALLLLLCLLPLTSTLAQGQPKELFTPFPQGEYLLGMVKLGDVLYLRTSTGLFSHKEEEEPQLLYALDAPFLEDTPNFGPLLSDGKDLYGYHPMQARLYPLVLGETIQFGKPISLDVQEFSFTDGPLPYQLPPDQVLLHAGRLYVLYTATIEGHPGGTLFSFDRIGGDKQVFEMDTLRRITPYKDGSLLCLLEAEAGIVSPGVLSVFEADTGIFSELGRLGEDYRFMSDGLLYDQARDLVYYQAEDKLIQRDSTGMETLVANLGGRNYNASAGMVVLHPGLVAFAHNRGVSIRQVNPPQLSTSTITIKGTYPDDRQERAMARMPDTSLDFLPLGSLQTDITKALILGDDSFDVYFFQLSQVDAANLMKKGYASPLEANTLLDNYITGLYPVLNKVCSLGGKPHLVPIAVAAQPLYVNLALFKGLGLPVPSSLEELLEFITSYQPQADEQLFEQSPSRTNLLEMAIRLWWARANKTGAVLSFSDPDFIRILELIKPWQGETTASWDNPGLPTLFPYGNELNLTYWSNDRAWYGEREPVFLSFLKDEEPMPLLEVTMAAVNPHAQQADLAISYIENYVFTARKVEVLLLSPGDGQPIQDPVFPQRQSQAQQVLLALDAQAVAATGAMKSELQQQADAYRASLVDGMEKNRWQVSADIIKEVQQIMQQAVVVDVTYKRVMAAGAVQILNRAMLGQVDFASATAELDARLALMTAENE